MQRCLQSRQNSCKVSKEFYLNPAAGLPRKFIKKCKSPFASILQGNCPGFGNTYFKDDTLNGCFLWDSAEILHKNPIQPKITIEASSSNCRSSVIFNSIF